MLFMVPNVARVFRCLKQLRHPKCHREGIKRPIFDLVLHEDWKTDMAKISRLLPAKDPHNFIAQSPGPPIIDPSVALHSHTHEMMHPFRTSHRWWSSLLRSRSTTLGTSSILDGHITSAVPQSIQRNVQTSLVDRQPA